MIAQQFPGGQGAACLGAGVVQPQAAIGVCRELFLADDDALEAWAAAKGEVGVRLGDDGEDAARAFRHTNGFKGQAGHDGAGDLFQQRHLADHIVGGRAVRQGAGTIAGGGVFQRFEAGAHALADGNVGAEIAAAGGDRRLAHGDEAVGIIRQGKGRDHRTT